jgi:hypothetical protein
MIQRGCSRQRTTRRKQGVESDLLEWGWRAKWAWGLFVSTNIQLGEKHARGLKAPR